MGVRGAALLECAIQGAKKGYTMGELNTAAGACCGLADIQEEAESIRAALYGLSTLVRTVDARAGDCIAIEVLEAIAGVVDQCASKAAAVSRCAAEMRQVG